MHKSRSVDQSIFGILCQCSSGPDKSVCRSSEMMDVMDVMDMIGVMGMMDVMDTL